jgi:hypothetical protein
MMFTNLGFHVQFRLLMFEGRAHAYRALCNLCASIMNFNRSQKTKEILGPRLENIPSGGDGYICMSERMESHSIPFFLHISQIICYQLLHIGSSV